MRLMITFFIAVAVLILALIAYSGWQARKIEVANPPVGAFADVNGQRVHFVHVEAGAGADLPPVLFLHGASGNLRDQLNAFREPLEGRAELLFVDRPGHGYSARGGPQNAYPDGQADVVAGLMEQLGIERAIIVAHSFGSAIAASFAVEHPGKTAGLLFLAPATHPWPGGVAWFYTASRMPAFGWLFTRTLALPAGQKRLARSARCVFTPNAMPDGYIAATAPELVLRPAAFRANGTDVANLKAFVERQAPRYASISSPTVIITGNRDGVVLPEIHSKGLERDIAGAELLWIDNLGHKPDYIATDLAIASIEKIAGSERDLQAMARSLEAQIASDDETC